MVQDAPVDHRTMEGISLNRHADNIFLLSVDSVGAEGAEELHDPPSNNTVVAGVDDRTAPDERTASPPLLQQDDEDEDGQTQGDGRIPPNGQDETDTAEATATMSISPIADNSTRANLRTAADPGDDLPDSTEGDGSAVADRPDSRLERECVPTIEATEIEDPPAFAVGFGYAVETTSSESLSFLQEKTIANTVLASIATDLYYINCPGTAPDSSQQATPTPSDSDPTAQGPWPFPLRTVSIGNTNRLAENPDCSIQQDQQLSRRCTRFEGSLMITYTPVQSLDVDDVLDRIYRLIESDLRNGILLPGVNDAIATLPEGSNDITVTAMRMQNSTTPVVDARKEPDTVKTPASASGAESASDSTSRLTGMGVFMVLFSSVTLVIAASQFVSWFRKNRERRRVLRQRRRWKKEREQRRQRRVAKQQRSIDQNNGVVRQTTPLPSSPRGSSTVQKQRQQQQPANSAGWSRAKFRIYQSRNSKEDTSVHLVSNVQNRLASDDSRIDQLQDVEAAMSRGGSFEANGRYELPNDDVVGRDDDSNEVATVSDQMEGYSLAGGDSADVDDSAPTKSLTQGSMHDSDSRTVSYAGSSTQDMADIDLDDSRREAAFLEKRCQELKRLDELMMEHFVYPVLRPIYRPMKNAADRTLFAMEIGPIGDRSLSGSVESKAMFLEDDASITNVTQGETGYGSADYPADERSDTRRSMGPVHTVNVASLAEAPYSNKNDVSVLSYEESDDDTDVFNFFDEEERVTRKTVGGGKTESTRKNGDDSVSVIKAPFRSERGEDHLSTIDESEATPEYPSIEASLARPRYVMDSSGDIRGEIEL